MCQYKSIAGRFILISFILTALLISSVSAQKLYIWCPEKQIVKQRVGFLDNQELDLVVFDGRSIPSNSKVECLSGDLVTALTTHVQSCYPSCKINVLSEGDYYKSSVNGRITIKIGIASYHSGFGSDIKVGNGSVGGAFSYGVFPSGQWNGIVSYYVQIFDKRKDSEHKASKEVSVVTSKSNMWGYKTAKSCLFESYNKANADLLGFIETTLMD